MSHGALLKAVVGLLASTATVGALPSHTEGAVEKRTDTNVLQMTWYIDDRCSVDPSGQTFQPYEGCHLADSGFANSASWTVTDWLYDDAPVITFYSEQGCTGKVSEPGPSLSSQRRCQSYPTDNSVRPKSWRQTMDAWVLSRACARASSSTRSIMSPGRHLKVAVWSQTLSACFTLNQLEWHCLQKLIHGNTRNRKSRSRVQGWPNHPVSRIGLRSASRAPFLLPFLLSFLLPF